jgi:hypothetical protein
MGRIRSLKEQVEYYLSDVNLRHDKFFHQKVTEGEGLVHVSVFMNCRKIKDAGYTEDQVLEAA